MNFKDVMRDRLLRGETIRRYKEGGNSMTPLIESKQPVDIRPIDRPIKVRDIVFAKVHGRYYLHLVSAIRDEQVQISNNHGRINGWTHINNVYGFVSVSQNRVFVSNE